MRKWIDIINESSQINELFRQAYELNWIDQRFGTNRLARFRTQNGLNYEITFQSRDGKSFVVNFEQGGNMHATGQGSAGQVFATVLEAIRQFVQTSKPARLEFTAMEASRAKLYRAMVGKLISEFPDYRLADASEKDGTNFVIAKKSMLRRLVGR